MTVRNIQKMLGFVPQPNPAISLFPWVPEFQICTFMSWKIIKLIPRRLRRDGSTSLRRELRRTLTMHGTASWVYRRISRTKRGNQGVVFFPGLFYNPQAPFIKGDFYIHYLLIRINKMKIPIPLNKKALLSKKFIWNIFGSKAVFVCLASYWDKDPFLCVP